MSNPNERSFTEILETISSAPPPLDVEKKSTSPDVEKKNTSPGVEKKSTPTIGVETAAIIKRKKREDMLKKSSLVLRWLCFIFSFLAFVLTASNRHGRGLNFEDYEEYSYLLAIAIISSVYSVYQGIREVIQLVNRKPTFSRPVFATIDFMGDQILAYLLISAASAAVPRTNYARQNSDNSMLMKFVDMASASISMAFLAFFTLALSLLISGYQLAAHFFI
ncbi:CASP-like protein 4B1, partial [Cucurbita argyrosperma subsp. argyrosperma]